MNTAKVCCTQLQTSENKEVISPFLQGSLNHTQLWQEVGKGER